MGNLDSQCAPKGLRFCSDEARRKVIEVSSLLIAAIISATGILSVVLGIFTAHFAITAILHTFGQQQRRPAPIALVPSQTHASGD